MSFDTERFAKDLADRMPDAVVYADAEGVIRYWNQGAERIFGFARTEAIGQTLDLMIPPSLRERHWTGYDHTLKTGETKYGAGDLLSVPALRKDGTRLSVEFTVIPFHDSVGRMVGIAAVMRDVSAKFEEMKSLRRKLAGKPERAGPPA